MLDMSSGAPRFKKSIKHNSVEKRVMDVVGLLNVVLFLPQDLSLIEGAPSRPPPIYECHPASGQSRLFPGAERIRENSAAAQRFAQAHRRKSVPARVELEYWDEQLASSGASRYRRADNSSCVNWSVKAQRYPSCPHRRQRNALNLRYLPSILPRADVDGGQMSFDLLRSGPQPSAVDRLKSSRSSWSIFCSGAPEAIRRGLTLAGPHRDELRLFINGRDCGSVWQPRPSAHRSHGAQIRRTGVDARSTG